MMVWPWKRQKPRCDVSAWAKKIAEKEREAAQAKMAREKAQAELLALFADLTAWKGDDDAPDD